MIQKDRKKTHLENVMKKAVRRVALNLGVTENVTMSRNAFTSGTLGSVSFPVLTNLEEAKIKHELGMLSSYCCIMANTPGKAEQARALQILWVT